MKPSSSPADWTPDSPELTAFALKDGPFDPAVPGWAERRAEAEQAVARSAALRAEIGEIRRLSDDVETDLAREPIHRLGSDRRESVLAYARNPGRGLPRRSSEGSTTEARSGGDSTWARFWSGLTRPAMGFGLAAATALSIALALWSPWSSAPRPAAPSQSRPAAVSNAAPATPERIAESAQAEGAGVAVGLPASASALPPQPSEEPVRGEPQLRWGLQRAASASPEPASVAAGSPPDPTSDPALLVAAVSSAGSSVPPLAVTDAALANPARAKVAALPAAKLDRAAPAPQTSARREARSTREIPFQSTATSPRSTVPLNPGKDSYPRVRKALEEGELPSPDAVRLEELLNYFSYTPPSNAGADPVTAHVEVADAPWSPDHRLVKIGVQARPQPPVVRPPANLVVLVGLRPGSSSRLAWAQRSLQTLIDSLGARDSLALLLDGPRNRLVLPPTSGADRAGLLRGISSLSAEGAPVGLDGLRKAYALAAQKARPGGIHRVIWILDGEFSAEPGTRDALAALIREQTEWGVLLSVLGFGSEPGSGPGAAPWVAAAPGGAYASVDSAAEAREALQRELRPVPTGVADGVEVEVRFNPDRVDQWRLLSQETRDPAAKSAPSAVDPRGAATGARMEAGQSVTALYELIPARSATAPTGSNDLLQLEVGYRPPSDADRQPPPSRSLRVDVPDVRRSADAATADYKFAAAVVGYGLLLRDSPFKGDLTWEKVLTLAEEGQGPDPEGYRAEFLSLVRRARSLQGEGPGAERPAAPVKSRP